MLYLDYGACSSLFLRIVRYATQAQELKECANGTGGIPLWRHSSDFKKVGSGRVHSILKGAIKTGEGVCFNHKGCTSEE